MKVRLRKAPWVLELSERRAGDTESEDGLIDDRSLPKPPAAVRPHRATSFTSASMAGGADARGNAREGEKWSGRDKASEGRREERGGKRGGEEEEGPQVPPPPLRVPVPDNVPTGARRVSSLEVKTVRRACLILWNYSPVILPCFCFPYHQQIQERSHRMKGQRRSCRLD